MLIHIKEIQSWIDRNLEFQNQKQSRFWIELHSMTFGQSEFFFPAKLRCQFLVANAGGLEYAGYGYGQMIPVTHSIDLPKDDLVEEGGVVSIKEAALVKHVFRAVAQFVVHEFAETFLFRGVREFNPHDGDRNAMLWSGIDKCADSPKTEFDPYVAFTNPFQMPLNHYAPVKDHPEYRTPQKSQPENGGVYSYTVTFDSVPEPEAPKTPMEKLKAAKERSREHFAKFVRGHFPGDYKWDGKKFKKAA